MVRHLGVSIATSGQQTGERHFISMQYENMPKNIKITDVKFLRGVARNIYTVNVVICQNNDIVHVTVRSRR